MENKTKREYRPRSRFYEKDYSKLEVIFQRAVERSRQKKIIHYGSDRLYSEDSLRRIAQDSFKTVSGAEPVYEKDVHTELRDLEYAELEEPEPEETEENDLFSFLSGAGLETEESDQTLTSESALKAYEVLADVSEEENTGFAEEETVEEEVLVEEPVASVEEEDFKDETPPFSFSDFFETVKEKTEPLLKEEPAISFEDLTEEISEEPKEETHLPLEEETDNNAYEDLSSEEAVEPEKTFDVTSDTGDLFEEPTEPVITEENAREFFEDDVETNNLDSKEISEAKKDVLISQLALVASVICLGAYLVLFFRNFSGFDYIALILTLVGFFLAADMKARGLIFTCIGMIIVLIVCMAITVYRTSEIIAFYHYIWFLLIPLAISTSYAFVNSRRNLRRLEKADETSTQNSESVKEESSRETRRSKEKYSETEDELLEGVKSYTGTIEINQEAVEETTTPPVKAEPEISNVPEEEPQTEKAPELLEENKKIEEDKKTPLSDRVEFITDLDSEKETPELKTDEISKENLYQLLDDYQEENTYYLFNEDTSAETDQDESSFDWGSALNFEERTDNPSVISEIGKDIPLASLFDTEEDFGDETTDDDLYTNFFEETEPGNDQQNDLGKLLESLEGQDENEITSDMTNSETIWSIIESNDN